MDTGLVHEIIDCLPQERTLYHYFKDPYAFYLLSRISRPQATGVDVYRAAKALLFRERRRRSGGFVQ